MNDKEVFGELVRAVEQLARPWKIALLVSNVFWALAFIVHALI